MNTSYIDNDCDSSDGNDNTPETGIDTLSASTLALLLEFLPNRRFEDDLLSNESQFNSNQACVAYTAGDVSVIAETLKRLSDKHGQQEELTKQAIAQRILLELMPSNPGKEALSTITRDGVVRIDSLLTYSLCDRLLSRINKDLLDFLNPDLKVVDSVFGNVLCKENRFDMYLRNEGVYTEALVDLLSSSSYPLSQLFDGLFDGEDASFHEFSSLISDRGAVSQPIHPDSRHTCTDEGFTLLGPMYTVFIALQDITKCMGPTIFLPRTNTDQAHLSH